MTFHCTLVSATHSGLVTEPRELTIEAPDGIAGAELHHHLVSRFGAGTVTVQGSDLRSLRVGTAPLINGAVFVDIGDSIPARRRQSVRRIEGSETGLALAVHTGSGAGTVVGLTRGTYTIGRTGTRIVIPDPEMSRQHARLTVTDTGIFLEDLDSSNGTWVEGQRVRNAAVSTSSDFRCGNSMMSLVFLDGPRASLAQAGLPVDDPIAVTGRTGAGSRAMLAITAVLPLVIGVGLAVWTGMWMFLAFAGASAVSVLVPLISGRRQRRDNAAAVTAAVQQDIERRRRAGPSLAALALGARYSSGQDECGVSGGRVWLRLGMGTQPANIRVEPAGTVPSTPSAGRLPVLLDPARTETLLQGARPVVDGVIRALVMQLAAYPCGSKTRVIIHGSPEFLPLASRFLPRVTLTAAVDECHRILAEDLPPVFNGVLILAGSIDPGDADSVLAATAVERGWQVLRFGTPGDLPRTPDVELSEALSVLRNSGTATIFDPDLAPPDVFGTFCRAVASRAAATVEIAQVARICGLGDILALSAAATTARWESGASSRGMAVPLGCDAGGIRSWDLEVDGPHLLVAGTTGSGKSELLRSLVIALALSHPPELVNFLFVDFKGGSGLGPLAGLVHCVGMLTDLSADGLDRTLISLRAEIRRREEALAAANVPDLATYRTTASAAGAEIPYLVIMIDEFRMLVDDAPEVLRELMRIASIGRSLGIHLVMATQRPQGALTADIRANVTSSIALRVQSDIESVDVIGTKDAAGIGVDSPGRAYIARGTEPAQEFQAATLGPGDAKLAASTVSVQLTTEYLVASCEDDEGPQVRTPAQAAQPLVALTHDLWLARGGTKPRQPVAPPLPHDLLEPVPGLAPAAARPANLADPVWSIGLGALDLPHEQRLASLTWEPSQHSHLALIGSPVSGAGDALELAVRRLMAHPHEAHCYLLDAPGGLLHAADHRRTGAHAGLHELRRAVRILERLTQEMGRRVSNPATGAVPLVLVIAGWGSWVSALRSGPLAWAEDLVHDLVRDGHRAGISVVVSGDRELANARFSGSIPNRLYFPAGSNEDSRVAWPRMPSTAAVMGRAVAFGPVSGGAPAVCQLYHPAMADNWDSGLAADPQQVRRPFRVDALPATFAATKLRDALTSAVPASEPLPSASAGLLIGVGGDELSPVRLRLPAGAVFTILGHPASGKSTALRALEFLNPKTRWLRPEGTETPDTLWKLLRSEVESGNVPADAVIIADDADRLPAAALQCLMEIHSLGHSIVLTAGYSPLLLQRIPLTMASRAQGTGMMLAPRSISDGDLFGVRFETEPGSPPGRAVGISGGGAFPFHVAWAPPAAAAFPGGSSIAGYRAGGDPPVREAYAITLLWNSRTSAVAAGISITSPMRTSPLVRVGNPIVNTNSWATSAAARVQRNPR